ncbi:MAG: photosynthetic reaction center cytochrome c subunit [Gemmatimonadetes bacterium]|nr:photosynthetic reaction center cytochrome c subunit [Gemmatimonadota bacterium]
MRTVALLSSLALAAIACSPTPPAGSPAPATGGTGAGVVAAAPSQQGGQPGQPGPGGPGGPPRRQPPNPMRQDTARRMMVDSILRTIAGRENEPAGTVFKNVKLLSAMPAGAFLRNMDEQYGRGLGWTCNNCHVLTNFADDSRKNKRIARQMQEMTDHINTVRLTSIPELDKEYDKATCVMCHRGVNEPKGSMPVPQPAPVKSGS